MPAQLDKFMDTPTALHLISLLDLTSLNATDTPEEIRALCEKASRPLSDLHEEEFETAMKSKYGQQFLPQMRDKNDRQ
jgi:deoxyribose-phosphate aldolase